MSDLIEEIAFFSQESPSGQCPDPLQGRNLIENPVIAARVFRSFSLESGMSKKAKWSKLIIEGPKDLQSLTPAHGDTGWGGFQRSSPVGGAAYGIPR